MKRIPFRNILGLLVFCLFFLCGCEQASNEDSYAATDDLQALYVQIDAAMRCGATNLALPLHGDACDVEALLSRINRESVYARTMLMKYAWNLEKNHIGAVLHLELAYERTLGDDIGAVKRQAAGLAARMAENCIHADVSDAEKALLLHDMLCHICEYDAAASPQSRWGFCALTQSTAVCEGYAEAYAMLLDAAGIPELLVSGYALPDMQPHMWNLVQLDGVWHHVDVTWDDTDEQIAYTYFLRCDSDFAPTHRWDASVYPAAKAALPLAEIEADLRRNFCKELR